MNTTITGSRHSRRSPIVAYRQKSRKVRIRIIVFACVGLLIVSFLTMHAAAALHEGGRRAVVERLTRAIAERDAGNIRDLFAPGIGDDVLKDLRMGALADRFNALGVLREVRVERVGQGNAPWIMVASFMHGTQIEHVKFTGDRVAALIASPAEVGTEVSARVRIGSLKQ